MPNLDIIYDVTTEVTWDERKTNKQVIYQTTSLPSFVTFDAFYFCLWWEEKPWQPTTVHRFLTNQIARTISVIL